MSLNLCFFRSPGGIVYDSTYWYPINNNVSQRGKRGRDGDGELNELQTCG